MKLGTWITAVVLLGCWGCKEDPPPTAAPSASAAPSKPAVDRNGELEKAVRAIAANCQYDLKAVRKTDCKNDERRAAKQLVIRNKSFEPWVVETLSDMMANETDPKLVAAAAITMGDVSAVHVRPGLDSRRNPKAEQFATVETARRLLSALKKHSSVAIAVIPIVHVATAKGLVAETAQALETLPGDSQHAERHRAYGYRQLLTFARLDGFEHIQAHAKKNPSNALGAITKLGKTTDAEKAKICPWVEKHLGDPNSRIAESAMLGMTTTCEKFAPVLDEIEKRAKGRKLDQAVVRPFQQICFTLVNRANAPTDGGLADAAALAKRCSALVRDIVLDDEHDKHSRVMAAAALGRLEDAATLAFCKRHSKNQKMPPEVQKALETCVTRIQVNQERPSLELKKAN